MHYPGTIKVISAKLSKSGYPLVVLATRHAYLFDTSLKCWLRVADDCFPASNFASSWTLGSALGGELAALQVDVRKYLARKPGWSRSVCVFSPSKWFCRKNTCMPLTEKKSAIFPLIGGCDPSMYFLKKNHA